MDMKQILLITGILILAFIISHIARRAIGRYWLHSSRKMNVHPSNYRIFKNAASVIIFTFAFNNNLAGDKSLSKAKVE
jgi:hypothetical protein